MSSYDDAGGELIRKGHLSLNTFSLVNQNGSFEFDRVIKAGSLLKKKRKTKTWQDVYIVLRPGLLSLYRDDRESRLKHQINLSELTAVARQRDPKRKSKQIFGLFLSSRNFYFEAAAEDDARDWVELIRREARMDEEEKAVELSSPTGTKNIYSSFQRRDLSPPPPFLAAADSFGSSSSEPEQSSVSRDPQNRLVGPRPVRGRSHLSHQTMSDSASASDFSYSGSPNVRDSSISITRELPEVGSAEGAGAQERRQKTRNESKAGDVGKTDDGERVACHGWLRVLKSKGGVKQWKKHWAVLRPKSFALYKSKEEYAAHLVVPFSSLIDAIEIDSRSRSRPFCIQLIGEDRNYRLAAPTEEALTMWLGAIKSLLSKRRERLENSKSLPVDALAVPDAEAKTNRPNVPDSAAAMLSQV